MVPRLLASAAAVHVITARRLRNSALIVASDTAASEITGRAFQMIRVGVAGAMLIFDHVKAV